MFFKKKKFNVVWDKLDKLKENRDSLDELYTFSKRNLSVVTPQYLENRFKKYKLLLKAYDNDKLVGYMFAHFYVLKIGLIKSPVVHIGLTVVDKDYRKQNVAGHLSYGVYQALNEKMKRQAWTFGMTLTSKCSSPISFLKAQKSVFNMGLPKIKDKDHLDTFSSSTIGKEISQRISELVAPKLCDDFLLENVNIGDDFLLEPENYVARNKKEEKIFDYFKKFILPNNELLFVSWIHPVFLIWW